MNKIIDTISGWVLGFASLLIVVALAFWWGQATSVQSATLGAIATSMAAIAIASHSKMKTYGFAAWVVCFVFVALLYPAPFLQFGPIKGVDILSYLI